MTNFTTVHQKFVKFTCGYRKKSVMVRGHQKASNLPENSFGTIGETNSSKYELKQAYETFSSHTHHAGWSL